MKAPTNPKSSAMKTTIASALRTAALATALGVLPALASATNYTPVDRAA